MEPRLSCRAAALPRTESAAHTSGMSKGPGPLERTDRQIGGLTRRIGQVRRPLRCQHLERQTWVKGARLLRAHLVSRVGHLKLGFLWCWYWGNRKDWRWGKFMDRPGCWQCDAGLIASVLFHVMRLPNNQCSIGLKP